MNPLILSFVLAGICLGLPTLIIAAKWAYDIWWDTKQYNEEHDL